MLRDLQEAIARAVVSGEAAAALAAIGDGARNVARLKIHRDNYAISLTQVLASTYPSVRRVLGFEIFNQVALAFIAIHPPCKPQLLDWGGEFSELLARLPLVADRPWLSDLARIDWARNEAYFATDTTPVRYTDIAAVPIDRYENLKFALLPSVRIFRSNFPITAMWSAAMALHKSEFTAKGLAEAVLVLRPAQVVMHRAITSGDQALLEALDRGEILARAAETAYQVEQSFDLTAALAAHLSGGTFATFALE